MRSRPGVQRNRVHRASPWTLWAAAGTQVVLLREVVAAMRPTRPEVGLVRALVGGRMEAAAMPTVKERPERSHLAMEIARQ